VLADSHAHLDMGEFDEDRDAVIERARQAGLATIINMGCDLPSSAMAIALAERYPEVYATVGFHPHDAAKMAPGDLNGLAEMARHPKVVGIGEIGLDFYRDRSPRDVQRRVFQEQLALAAELGLPVAIHSRNALSETLEILHNWTRSLRGREGRGVLHCYSGDVRQAEELIDLSFYISLAGPITYPGARTAVEVARTVPLDRLLVETDCPFLTPQPHRGKRNEPAYVAYVVKKIAQVRDMPVEAVAEATAQNTIRLFARRRRAEG